MPAPGGSGRAGAFTLSIDDTDLDGRGPPGLAHDWRTGPQPSSWSQMSRVCRLSKPAAIDLIDHPGGLPIEPALQLTNGYEHSSTPTDNPKLGANVLVEEVPGDPE